ncbi:unnamed protein product [Porites lobata]|uniref:Pinin n=1 Tax=Porites lobata TaxID=104759 RepID=A0ABN8PE15_9CNID|nr:unnamed protein product [Porites lobata]
MRWLVGEWLREFCTGSTEMDGNGIMTYAIPSEGNSVTDHGYNERVSHVTPDSVISQVTPDSNGSTPLNAHENGHDQQEHYNESSSSATESSPIEESNLPEQQLSEEKCERNMNKVEGNVPQEEKAPEVENKDPGSCLDAHAEQKIENSEEEKPELASEQKTEAASEQTAEQAEIKETSPSPASEEEEPMDEN